MGLAYTGGVCKPELSCVINEFGTVDYRGRPYPSAGALSSYVLAHEIGHRSSTCGHQPGQTSVAINKARSWWSTEDDMIAVITQVADL
ncbi:hypothetical protein SK128_001998 [Halocaridina rubra]|uniref:Uncharacterized protein n=1 Tax=Halocaridina rubra TaxID=373956 RepID=A0AAN8WNA3_HALRR